jgi:acyl-CoA synthetase (AMP-forming)/AMP-acid ligase II
MQVHEFLELSAERFPDRKAAWYKDEWKTFAELDRMANQLGNCLREHGVRRGDRVALLHENSFDYIAAYYGILKAGAVTVALNTETTSDSLRYLLTNSGARAIVTHQGFSRHLVPVLPDLPDLEHVIVRQDDLAAYETVGRARALRLQDVYAGADAARPRVRGIDLDLASIVYTSGSTGKAKGAVLRHYNIVANTRSIVEYLRLTPDDRVMVVLPFYYIYGKSLLNTHFAVGGSVVMDNRFAFPNVILETMKKTEVTGLAGVPSTFMILLSRSVARKETFPSLRYLTQAGGAMAPAVQKDVAETFAPAKLFVMYGATEASARLSYLDPEDLPRKWGSIGKAIPNVDLFVADEAGHEVPQGEVGELVARGTNFMEGYWKDPEETGRVMRHGLYYTGDLGRMDEEGFLYVVGRTKDMIKVGGERVSAKEIEETILELKEVQEVAVIGVDDEVLGEAIKAFVIAAPGHEVGHEGIVAHCRQRLPLFKVPKFVEIVAGLPKNESGKVLKPVLREMEKKAGG